MRKCYMMLVAMVLTVLCATTAYGQKIYQAELDDSFFKAWTSDEPGAQEDADPAPEPKSNNPFRCENNLYKEVGGYGCVWGSSNVYCLWYADLTGTKTITVTGTPGMSIRMMMNRVPFVEGGTGDADGGAYVELIQNIGEDGTVVFDVSNLDYVHLNAIKVPGGGTAGVVRSIVLEGTVKPVTGFMSLINNGDAEGDDLSSFPVSYDGPNNGGTANDLPEIVDGGVDGSKCFKVTSFAEPTETWHTQFYVKADEVMPKGSKFILKMAVKADRECSITTSSQAAPRDWRGGFIDEFGVTTEWKTLTWTGVIPNSDKDDIQSFAFDLNNEGGSPGNASNVIYFDNIEFGYDLGSANPASDITGAFGGDVIEVKLSGTNIPDLVKAGDGKKVILPNECVEISWNGKAAHPISVEGRPNGNLYIFMLDVDGDEDYFGNDLSGDVVKVAFTNPTDPACQLLFTEGKWQDQPVPDFSGVVCAYNEDLAGGEYVSYMWDAAELESAEPEAGSFNLAADLNEFTLTFNQSVEVATVNATLGKEKLTASAAEEFSNVITLTRTATTALNGEIELTVTNAVTERGAQDLQDPIVLKYSFGPVTASDDDQPATIYASNFSGEGDDANGAGWLVNNESGGLQAASSGSGCRIMHGQDAFSADLVYVAQRGNANGGIALYGIEEEHKLALEAKTYHVIVEACRHDRQDNGLRVQVLSEDYVDAETGTLVEDAVILAEDYQEITLEKNSKKSHHFDLTVEVPEAGNYVIRLVPTKWSTGGSAGYDDAVCFGDVKVEYLPSTMGLLETKTLEAALDAAKKAREDCTDPRYAGTAYSALDGLITEYDGKTLTAPSVFAKATEDLNNASKVMTDHAALCDAYDALPVKAFELYESKKDTKFVVTDYFQNLAAAVNKYCTFATETIFDQESGEEITGEVLQDFIKYYDDDQLNAAKDELTEVITMAEKCLTDGKSNNNQTSGYAALHERLRRGVELLKSLGMDENANVIQVANAELGDNDEIAEAIMRHATTLIMADLASENSKLFAADEESETTPSYDLSVFVKNPNTYGPAESKEVPGWTATMGEVFAWNSWDGAKTHQNALPPYAEDCSIHAGWHPNGEKGAIVEQTIENLPAGVYSIQLQIFDNGGAEDTFGFIRTSETAVPEEGEEFDRDLHTAGTTTSSSEPIADVEITDGQLTLGYHYGGTSQAFLEDVTITLTGPATGFDYAGTYKQIVDGVETAKTAKVRSIAVFDLNGRRVVKANKGINIVKKVMSDGTVKTQKVVK